MRIFDIIGPIMIGPSSSHTAGACRMSRAARQLLGEDVKEAKLELHGSFEISDNKEVNPALIAGLLGYNIDDRRIHNSLKNAEIKGISLTCINVDIEKAHVNTARFTLKGNTNEVKLTVSSIGGGMIEVTDIDDAPVKIKGNYYTMIIFCKDADETLKEVKKIISNLKSIENIEQSVSNDGRTQLVLIKSKKVIPKDKCVKIWNLNNAIKITSHDRFE